MTNVMIVILLCSWLYVYVYTHKERTRDLWNTRSEPQIQTKLDQPPWKNGQHKTPETRLQLQTSRKKRPWTPQETMAMRRCRNRSNDLIHGGRWWWWWWWWWWWRYTLQLCIIDLTQRGWHALRHCNQIPLHANIKTNNPKQQITM